jgi:hypothetical protein
MPQSTVAELTEEKTRKGRETAVAAERKVWAWESSGKVSFLVGRVVTVV